MGLCDPQIHENVKVIKNIESPMQNDKEIFFCLKGQSHEIFNLYIFSLIEPIWVPDKQTEMVFLKNLFCEDIRI